MGIWYQTSSKLTSTYLQNVSESSMKDAYHAFEYLLTDTSYMATMISENQKNVIQPVNTLNSEQIKQIINGIRYIWKIAEKYWSI